MKTCPYCLLPASLLRHGQAGYPYQRSYGPIWTCVPCQSWVGCHPGTENALGRLANAELRAAKQEAHAAFDPLWKRKMVRDQVPQGRARRAGYRWLSEQMGIAYRDTHIGEFDVNQCRRVVELCSRFNSKETP
jgi:hypothetical protein